MDNPIRRYLEDAISAQKSFETQLKGFAKEASMPEAKQLFEQHAGETRVQYERLTARLEALGGSISPLKSFFAHLFSSIPKTAQLGHTEEERTTQDLMMAYAVENAEVAMYQALAVSADTVSDADTVTLVRSIQSQERLTADKIWPLIAPSAVEAFEAVKARGEEDAQKIVIRYLQDAEAAERNFEDALKRFSQSGDQANIQSVLAGMADKALTQHERLEDRLRNLGASPSSAKSLLAHLLAFTPLTAQFGHDEAEKSTQHLMITYAAAAAEMAMYEALAAVAVAAGDVETAALARELQGQESEDHRLAWEYLPDSARTSLHAVLSHT
jgi:ferritin-like metal-binding protein YciE